MKFKCPVCGSKIQVNYEETVYKEFDISENGRPIKGKDKLYSNHSIFCSQDQNHELGENLNEEILKIICDAI